MIRTANLLMEIQANIVGFEEFKNYYLNDPYPGSIYHDISRR